MAYPRLPLQQQAEIIDAFVQAGMTAFEIGEMHHIAEGQVLAILHAHEIPTGRRGQRSFADKFSEAQLQDIIDEYKGDGSVKDIRLKYGLTYQQLYGILDQFGVPSRAHTPDRMKDYHSRLQLAVEMYVDNVFVWKITQETGIAQPVLYAELHSRNIDMRVRRYRNTVYPKH